MNYIQRNKDIITSKSDLELLYTFKDFPVFMGCTEQSESKDLFSDMNWYISPSSGMIQLNPILPLEVIYAEDHGSGTVGNIWNEHHNCFSEFIKRNKEIKSVLEIGGSNGNLARKCTENRDIKWTIIEPNPKIVESDNIKVVKDFFDDNFRSEEKYDAVIHSHVLEHLYDPMTFMNHVANFMKTDSLLIMSVPNLKKMLSEKYTNCLNFEHTYFASEDYVKYFLSTFGYELLKIEYFRQDHSIFFCAKKSFDRNEDTSIPQQFYIDNKKIFEEYISYHENLIKTLNNLEENIYLFGAHIFSQYLLKFGLDSNKVINILDNDPNKQNKRLYGTSIIVKSPEILRNQKSATVILKAGMYNDEIKQQINNINSNIKFI